MNLFLTSRCNERCSFCYAERWFDETPPQPNAPDSLERLRSALRTYGDLVRAHGPLPTTFDGTTAEGTLYAAGNVALLGGEPTIHPHFARIVDEVAAQGLTCAVFTNASMPERIQAVADRLVLVIVNGLFADRAPALGLPENRVHANLPIQPGQDVLGDLARVRDAGIKTVYLAFASPAGAPGEYYTPNDLEAMQAVHRAATAFCREAGIFLAYDCSFPVCVDAEAIGPQCTSVPVLDATGDISICGGDYFLDEGRRPIESFGSLRELHDYTFSLIARLRGLPSRFDVCNGCEHFNDPCHGMCLTYRQAPEPARPAGGSTLPRARG